MFSVRYCILWFWGFFAKHRNLERVIPCEKIVDLRYKRTFIIFPVYSYRHLNAVTGQVLHILTPFFSLCRLECEVHQKHEGRPAIAKTVIQKEQTLPIPQDKDLLLQLCCSSALVK